MILNAQTSYPQAQSFVLKLHRDAAPTEGRILGRLEHVSSGRQFNFATADELVACLVSAATLNTPATESAP